MLVQDALTPDSVEATRSMIARAAAPVLAQQHISAPPLVEKVRVVVAVSEAGQRGCVRSDRRPRPVPIRDLQPTSDVASMRTPDSTSLAVVDCARPLVGVLRLTSGHG